MVGPVRLVAEKHTGFPIGKGETFRCEFGSLAVRSRSSASHLHNLGES